MPVASAEYALLDDPIGLPRRCDQNCLLLKASGKGVTLECPRACTCVHGFAIMWKSPGSGVVSCDIPSAGRSSRDSLWESVT